MEKTANIIGLIACVLMAVGIVMFTRPRHADPAVKAKRIQLLEQFNEEAEAAQARMKTTAAARLPSPSPKP